MTDLLVNFQPALSGIELILFDKDGTLIDIDHYWGIMLKHRSELIANTYFDNFPDQRQIRNRLIDAMGMDLVTGRIKPHGPVGIKARTFIVSVVADIIRSYSIEIEDKNIEALFKKVDRLTSEKIRPMLKLLPGVKTFLEACKKTEVVLAIVTTDKTERAGAAVDALALTRYFDYIVGGDQVRNVKPSGDAAEFVLQATGIDRNKAVVIGDHMVDVLMGIDAGVNCNIGVLTGLGDRKGLGQLTPWVISSFEELSLG